MCTCGVYVAAMSLKFVIEDLLKYNVDQIHGECWYVD